MLALARTSFPIGMPVKYYPVDGEARFIRANIRSEPWRLGHGAIVIKITGITGCVSVEHLERVMEGLALNIIAPNTPEAHAAGCTCPDPADRMTWSGVMLSCGGHLFSASCPVHRHAVQAEVQRRFGRPQ